MTDILWGGKILGMCESCISVRMPYHCIIAKVEAICKNTTRVFVCVPAKGRACEYGSVTEPRIKIAGVRTMLSKNPGPSPGVIPFHSDSLILRVTPSPQGPRTRGAAAEPAPSRGAFFRPLAEPNPSAAGARRLQKRRVSSLPGAGK